MYTCHVRYKLLISYDGTDFSGWQIQPNSPTIQAEIERALSLYCREEIRLIGSGRTDAGVHATGQVAHFTSSKKLSATDLVSLNAILPHAISLRKIEHVNDTFHALCSAKRKCYTYHIYNGKHPGPFLRRYAAAVWDPIDINRLRAASKLFIGKIDFASFANVCKHRMGKSTVRHLFAIDVDQEGPCITLTFEGEGFLYKMVRNLVGGMLLVATGKMEIEELKEILESKQRTKAIPCADARGLFLRRVDYELGEAPSEKSILIPLE